MITLEDSATIKNLNANNPTVSLRVIGNLLGLSHNTVKRAKSRDSPPKYVRAEDLRESVNKLYV